MKAFIFPGQGSQYPGMGKELAERSSLARALFAEADRLLGFPITELMIQGTVEDLRQTRVTQPAIFLHSVILCRTLEDFAPAMVAGHSLGEFSALVAAGALEFEEGLTLVARRAMAMQEACEKEPSAMAAILGMEDRVVDEVCLSAPGIVVPANYNCPGQVVVSGTVEGVEAVCRLALERGAKRAIPLVVGGAFHSPLMEPAREELARSIDKASFRTPVCPVYQNVDALPTTDPGRIRHNLVEQLTRPVRWSETIRNMIRDGAREFTEAGPGKVLRGLVQKTDGTVAVSSIENPAG